MNIGKLVTILGSAALLAGCGGGASGPTPASLSAGGTKNPATTQGSTTLSIGVNVGALKSASNHRSTQQITSDVTALQVTITNAGVNSGNPVETTYSLSAAPCSGSSPTYTCVVAAPAGSDSVYVATAAGATIVGYAVPLTKSVTSGQTTSASFTLTPVAASFSGSEASPTAPDGGNLPEDAADHAVNVTANVDAPSADIISTPIDTLNLFGTVTVTTVPAYTVTPPAQAAASATAGSYAAAGYTFTYDGSQIGGDSLSVKAAYTNNATTGPVETLYDGLVTAASTATQVFTIPLVRLELPSTNVPSNASLGGTNFDVSGSYYYIAPSDWPANDGTTAAVVFNGTTSSDFTLNVTETNQPAAPVKDTTGTTCGTGIYTIGAVTGSGPYTTPITIHQPVNDGQTAACVLVIKDASFPTLTQAVSIYPTTLTIGTLSLRRGQ